MTSQSEPRDEGEGLSVEQKALAEVLVAIRIYSSNLESLMDILYGKGYLNDDDVKAIHSDAIDALAVSRGVSNISGNEG